MPSTVYPLRLLAGYLCQPNIKQFSSGVSTLSVQKYLQPLSHSISLVQKFCKGQPFSKLASSVQRFPLYVQPFSPFVLNSLDIHLLLVHLLFVWHVYEYHFRNVFSWDVTRYEMILTQDWGSSLGNFHHLPLKFSKMIVFWAFRLTGSVQTVVMKVWHTPQDKPDQLMRDRQFSMAVHNASKKTSNQSKRPLYLAICKSK